MELPMTVPGANESISKINVIIELHEYSNKNDIFAAFLQKLELLFNLLGVELRMYQA